MIFALVPAAGKSLRMGRPKLLLPLGQTSVLEHVLEALVQAGIERTLVVVGPACPELVPVAERAGAYAHLLAEPTSDMRETIECGLRWLDEHFQPGPEDQLLLLPADHPTTVPQVIVQLQQAAADHPGHSIFIPSFKGKRGHPVLLKWKHVPAIRGLLSGLGINAFLRQQNTETLEIAVENEEILRDLDTPDEYRRLQHRP
jgi:molybdenum cofactor cytidylyltransferase